MHKQNKVAHANAFKCQPFLEFFLQFALPNSQVILQLLSDGTHLLEIVQLIKDLKVHGQIIDAPKTFSHRLTNLKLLFKSIESFWTNTLDQQIRGEEIDLVEIAKTGDCQEISKLFELVINTAVQAENKHFFIEKMLQTSQETQSFLKRVVEKVLVCDKESPRKQKQKRMYDKILELDHENEKLLTVIHEICNEKLELQQKIKLLGEKLSDKSKQVEHYEYLLQEDAYTPQKKRIMGIPDTSDRKDSLIEALKQQIADMSANHERQLQAVYVQMEKLNSKSQLYDKIKNELQLSREIIDSHKEFREQAQLMEHELSQMKADNMNKENHIGYMKEKLEKANRIIVDLQTALTVTKGDLQRKSIQISELIGKLQDMEKRMSPSKFQGNNLFSDFPGVVNTESEAYIETNKSLRQQLQRTRKKLSENQGRLERAQQQIELLRGCDAQNRKLREMVVEYNTYRGQENQILVSSLYHLRKMKMFAKMR